MDGEGIKEIADLARDAGIIEIIEGSIRPEGIPIAVVPKGDGGFAFESVKPLLDAYHTAPERRAGTATAATLDALVDLTNRHKDEGSVVFGDLFGSVPSLTTVVDYHDLVNAPRYGKHRIRYAFPISPEWKAWKAQDGAAMSQTDWAAFIEEHVAELAAPDEAEQTIAKDLFQTTVAPPTRLVTLSRGLQISVEAKVKETVVLATGEAEIVFEEVHRDGSGKTLKIPGLFVISIPLFIGAQPSRLIARLRYRRAGQSIVWFYQLYRADEVVRARLTADLAAVAERTGLPVFEGSPEA